MTTKVTEMTARYRRLCVGLIGMVALLAGGPTPSQAQIANPARCEALKLKKESAYYDCLSRCERRVRRGGISADDCEQGCQTAFDAAVFRVEQSDPCQPPPPTPTPTPDPQQCEAQLLQIQARELLCQGRCAARGERNPDYDEAGCDEQCNTRCQTSSDMTMAKVVCSQGRVAASAERQGTPH